MKKKHSKSKKYHQYMQALSVITLAVHRPVVHLNSSPSPIPMMIRYVRYFLPCTGLLKTHMDTVATFGESKEVEVKRLVSRLLELLSEK